jgi:hypothetical protein
MGPEEVTPVVTLRAVAVSPGFRLVLTPYLISRRAFAGRTLAALSVLSSRIMRPI